VRDAELVEAVDHGALVVAERSARQTPFTRKGACLADREGGEILAQDLGYF